VPPDKRLDTLIAGYVEGDLTAEERGELLALIEADPAAGRRLLDEIDIHETINVAAQDESGAGTEFVKRVRELWEQEIDDAVSGYYTVPAERLQRKGRARSWGVWVSVAACLAIVVGALVYNERSVQDFPERLVASIESAAPGIVIHRDGGTIVVAAGMEIRPGDRVETGDEGAALLYRSERITLDLGPRTSVTLLKPDERKPGTGRRFHVGEGRVKGDVEKQPEGQPVVLFTPHAEALVKGTVFVLSVEESSTRLDVTEGTVAFTRESDGKTIDVAAGHFASTTRSIFFEALPIPTEDLLPRLVEGAAAAKTAGDVKALGRLATDVYKAEAEKLDRANLLKTAWLGAAFAVVCEPKLDRQADDLRFLLKQAVDAGGPGGGALSGEWSPGERVDLLRRYHKAKTLLAHSFFDEWFGHMNALINVCDEKDERGITDALGFEVLYVTFYQRGLPGSTLLMFDDVPAKLKGLPGHAYFEKHILPAVIERNSAFRRLEDALDFDSIWKSAGSWELIRVGSKRTGKTFFRRIQQIDPEAGDTFLCFRKPRFDEAILTGQAKVLAVGPRPGSPTYLFGYVADRKLQGHGPTNTMVKTQELDRRWMWFRIHFLKRGEGKWSSVRWMWHEGRQPYDVRRLPLAELPPPKQSSIDAGLMDAGGSMTIGAGSAPPIAVGCRGAAVEWRALGLEILRPAGASDGGSAEGHTLMRVGKVIQSDDFTQGLGGWKFGTWPGPPGGDDPEWKDSKTLGITVENVNVGGARKRALVFTSREPKGKRTAIIRISNVDRRAFAASAFVRLRPEKGGCHLALWNRKGTKVREKKLKADPSFLGRDVGKWVQIVTQFVQVEGEDGEPLIDCRTYWDGKLVLHEVVSGPGGPLYMTVEGKARVEMTDFVVNELVPAEQGEDGKR